MKTHRRDAEDAEGAQRKTFARRRFLRTLGAATAGLPLLTPDRFVLEMNAQHQGLTTLDFGLWTLDTSNIADTVTAHRVRAEVPIDKFDHAAWNKAQAVGLTRYWSGAEAPEGRHAEARIIWSKAALSVRFVCRQTEPLVVSSTPRTNEKTIGLWDRDVCEIFIAPDARTPEKYFEFEVAPTGERLDLAIHVRPDGRETDWHYISGMAAAAHVSKDSIMVAMHVPWHALTGGRVPRAGERWRVNLFRCVGSDPQRGYLAWQPTRTPEPNFHVPAAFGWLEFKG